MWVPRWGTSCSKSGRRMQSVVEKACPKTLAVPKRRLANGDQLGPIRYPCPRGCESRYKGNKSAHIRINCPTAWNNYYPTPVKHHGVWTCCKGRSECIRYNGPGSRILVSADILRRTAGCGEHCVRKTRGRAYHEKHYGRKLQQIQHPVSPTCANFN